MIGFGFTDFGFVGLPMMGLGVARWPKLMGFGWFCAWLWVLCSGSQWVAGWVMVMSSNC